MTTVNVGPRLFGPAGRRARGAIGGRRPALAIGMTVARPPPSKAMTGSRTPRRSSEAKPTHSPPPSAAAAAMRHAAGVPPASATIARLVGLPQLTRPGIGLGVVGVPGQLDRRGLGP